MSVAMLPRGRFTALLHRLGGRGAAVEEAFARLAAAYAEPHRAYHTAAHIEACLAWLDQIAPEAARPDEVECAVCFHDAVYDTRRMDNEEESARLAAASLSAAGLAPDVVQRIGDLVRATRAHQAADRDAAVLLDIDLAILGAPEAEYERFEDGIRREYAWVDEEVFRATRAAVLGRFLARPAIYATAPMRQRLESRARANLRHAVERLTRATASGRR